MGREQQPGGDYGYDLVHEDLGAATGRPDPAEAPGRAAPPTSGAEDRPGDHGYDEAHDF